MGANGWSRSWFLVTGNDLIGREAGIQYRVFRVTFLLMGLICCMCGWWWWGAAGSSDLCERRAGSA